MLSLVVACATAVDQGFVGDADPDSGGSHASGSGSGGKVTATGGSASSGGKTSGSGGKTVNAFGGTASAGTDTGGAPDGESGSGGASGSPSGGTASGGKAGAGTGGKASGGSGGTSAGTAGNGGTSAGGTAGSGGSTSSTGECAPANSGWVVQYWTDTPAANMPAGNMRIFNDSGQTVNFTSLELRHYFTNEETATLTFTFSTFGHSFPVDPYYQDEVGTNVLSSILAVAPAVTNASHYIRIKFNATPGSFGPNEWAQVGFYGSLSMYPLKSNQANDYTYIGHATSDPGGANKNAGWDHVTLYKDGALVWGCEP